MRSTRAEAFGLAAAAIAALVYGATLAPTVGAGDSGELILAAESLGVPHPPGYPLWLVLARGAALIPIGAVAWRVNALSAILSAVAVGLFYLLALRVGLRRNTAALVTAFFGASTMVWRSAVEAEVYPLATVAFLALGLLALRAREESPTAARHEAWFFFVAGLAPLVHQTLVAPALILSAWLLARRPRVPRLLRAAAFAAAGFSVFFVVPI
ncbi:MAG: protein O-mannosyl-transferase family, partial [Candidatus Eiseniibacteriota bacterium]